MAADEYLALYGESVYKELVAPCMKAVRDGAASERLRDLLISAGLPTDKILDALEAAGQIALDKAGTGIHSTHREMEELLLRVGSTLFGALCEVPGSKLICLTCTGLFDALTRTSKEWEWFESYVRSSQSPDPIMEACLGPGAKPAPKGRLRDAVFQLSLPENAVWTREEWETLKQAFLEIDKNPRLGLVFTMDW